MNRLPVVILSLFAGLALSQSSRVFSSAITQICDGFLPLNRTQIRVSDFDALGVSMTEAQFNADIEKVAAIYNPLFADRGWLFRIKKIWSNNNLNSVAYIDDDGARTIEIWGGLARSPYITDDALTLVVCHEVGHHLGGAPRFSFQSNGWAAVEGQADYFATTKCLRRVFAVDGGSLPPIIDPIVLQKCNLAYGDDANQMKICARIAMASLSAAALSSSISETPAPSFSSADNRVVVTTNEQHPAGQCRLDTFLKGDLCRVNEAIDFSAVNSDVGACRNITAENYGARPLCWFKPNASL